MKFALYFLSDQIQFIWTMEVFQPWRRF